MPVKTELTPVIACLFLQQQKKNQVYINITRFYLNKFVLIEKFFMIKLIWNQQNLNSIIKETQSSIIKQQKKKQTTF